MDTSTPRQRDIYIKRIAQFVERVRERRYGATASLDVTFTYDAANPIPIETLETRKWKPIKPGARWGELWGSAWFRIVGTVPKDFAGKEVVALVDLGSEGCLFRDGSPYQGITDPARTGWSRNGKRRIELFRKAKGGESVDLLFEAGANALFGYHGHREFVLTQADIAVLDRPVWDLWIDLAFLYDLAKALPERSVRGRRILAGLNEAANVWAGGAGQAAAAKICRELLKQKANASATTGWSVGHAHLDLGWLWPVRESRRKAGRTFSTALRMIEEYPDYVFGASQPQALEWVKDDYPALFAQIQKAVAAGNWECQGAMWVEPDMNVPSGEALVRQLVYGKRFFREHFGVDVRNLWLPDVFGYSAALPQILKSAGVDFFMTQKISWNETNIFPHHTFEWEGIDGTRIRTHFLPTNTYNATNSPGDMVPTEERFAQADVSSDWLNLYGIGDGGGGPGRLHIEYARRAADVEGMPKLKFGLAQTCFDRILKIPASSLPLWRGELYLELHRGTYTTQAKMKRYNRKLELALRDTEFFAAIAGLDQAAQTDPIWKRTLLNQFHDILPGSSITLVYETAHRESEENLATLAKLTGESLDAIDGKPSRSAKSLVVHNTLSWRRAALVVIPWSERSTPVVRDAEGNALVAQPVDGGLVVPVTIPAMGRTGVTIESAGSKPSGHGKAVAEKPTAAPIPVAGRWSRDALIPVVATKNVLENALLKVRLAADGSIASIYDKEFGREALAGGANRLLVWEDLPYSWDAWDISHYYRETAPEQARLVTRELVEGGPLRAVVEQRLSVGTSTIVQKIVLEAESRLVRIENTVEWSESSRQLRVQALPAVHASTATYEVQFGTVKRPAHGNTSWDSAQFEVAGQRFADLSQPDYGLGLVNDSKYGHYIRDGVMELTLLRSPHDPDPTADQGTHEFVFGYYPHALGWESSDLLERAHELNVPVVVHGSSAPLSESVSEFEIAGGLVSIDTMKRPIEGEGVVLRLYETRGSSHEVILRSRRPIATISEVDLLEENPRVLKGVRASKVDGFASEVKLPFSPYQLRSLRITFT